MIERTFKTIGRDLTVKIPSRLDEITLGQMIDFCKEGLTDLEAIAALTSIPVEALYGIRDVDAAVKAFVPIAESLRHQYLYLYNGNALPEKLTLPLGGGKSKVVRLDGDLGFYTYGGVMEAMDIMSDEINRHIRLYGEEGWKEHFKPDLRACGLVLCHFLYNRVYRKVPSEPDITRFFDVVKWLPITEAGPIARYFFLNYQNLPVRNPSYWHRLQQRWKNALALRLLAASAITTR